MNHLYKRLATGLFLCFSPLLFFGQVLSGSVYNGKRGEPLNGAIISLSGTTISSITNHEGRFSLANIPVGKSEILIQREGFLPRIAVVEYDRGQDTISIGIALCPSTKAYAQDRQSIAWRRPRDNQKTPQAVASLDQLHLREIPARGLTEALTALPGITQIQNGYASAGPQIRGLSGRNILLLQDDIPVLPVTQGLQASPWWFTVDPSSFARIEALRGSGSVAYGNNATGGVISLKSPFLSFSDQHSQVHGHAGLRFQPGDREMGGNVATSFHSKVLALSLNVYRRNFGAMPLSSGSNSPQPAGYNTLGGSGKLGIRLGTHHRLDIGIDQHQLVADSFNVVYPQGPTEQSLRRGQLYLRWTGEFDEPWWKTIRVTAVQQEYGMSSNLTDDIAPIREEEDLHTFRAMVEVHSKPNWLWQAVSGVEVAHHEIESRAWMVPVDGAQEPVLPSMPNGATQEEIGLYSLHTLDILKLRLAFGGRAQAQRVSWDESRWGQENWSPQALVGNISAMYPLARGVEITSSFRTGFRAPGLADLRSGYPMPGGIVNIPSDSLGTERTFSSEIGLKAKNKYFSGSLVVYHAQMNDWIRQIASLYQGSPVWQGLYVQRSINIDQQFVQGVEAEVEVPLYKAASVYGSVTYTHGMNVTLSDHLPAIPPINSRLGLRYNPGEGVWSRLEWRHASSQTQLSTLDLLNPAQDDDGTNAWNVVNLHVGYDFRWGYMMLGIENMFDARYRMHGSSIESPGRLLIFSMQVGF